MKTMKVFVEIPYRAQKGWPEYGSRLTCKYPTKDRKYIKSLSNCRNFATMKDIYPNVKNPLSHEIHKLWRLGYVKKYSQCTIKTLPDGSVTFLTDKTHVWYKITPQGIELLKKVGI